MTRRIFTLIIFLLVGFTFFSPTITKFSDSTIAIYILIVCLALWIFEIVPIAVTGLLVPVLAVSNSILTVDEAFSVFGSPIIALLICVLILTRVMVVSGLAERIAVYLVCSRLVGNSLRSLIIAFSFFCWLLAWWMSNTAACALFLPIILGLLPKLKEIIEDDKAYQNLTHRLLLTCAFTPSIGGMVTPVGSLPNLVSIEALRNVGISMNFINWSSYALPISFVFLLCMILLLEVLFPVPSISLSGIKEELDRKSTLLPGLKFEEKVVGISFLFTIFLWLLPSIVEIFSLNSIYEFSKNINVGVSAIIGVVLMFFLLSFKKEVQVSWKDASNFDWGIILLFAGGLCLGKMIISAKVPEYFFDFDTLSSISGIVLASYCIPATIILSEFCSNTVAASIFVPFVLSINYNDIALAVITALSAGFGFMLPISTPPNAIVFGTGKIPLSKMILAGFLFDLIGSLVLFIYYYLLY